MANANFRMIELDGDRVRQMWIRRRDILIDVIALLDRKPNAASWTGREWRIYRYARAVSRRLGSTN